nr:hypothetical protein [Lactobacillus sp. ESL0261]
MARNLLGRCAVGECVPCARISTGLCLVYYCLVDLYRQAQVNKKTVPTITLASYGIGLFD